MRFRAKAWGGGASLLLAIFVLSRLSSCHTPASRLPVASFPAHLTKSSRDFMDLRCAIHVHSEESSDANGTLDEIIAAAREVGIDAVVITDHNNRNLFSSAGRYDDVTILVGNEKGGGGHILSLGHRNEFPHRVPRRDLVDRIHEEGGFSITAHPLLWSRKTLLEELDYVDALEIYSLSTDVLSEGRLSLFWKALIGLNVTPETTLLSIVDGPTRELKLWDRALEKRRIVGVGAVDSHHTYGLTHSMAFRVVQTHVLSESREPDAILEALRLGRCYVTFEIFHEVPFFLFETQSPLENLQMGEEGSWQRPCELKVHLPREAEIRIVQDGKLIARKSGWELTLETQGPGVYRVEAWLGDRLWIASNPIYLRDSTEVQEGPRLTNSSR